MTFKSLAYGTCLTAGSSGVAYATGCNGSSYQKWAWLDNQSYTNLWNQATGRCLATDNATSLNATWTSSCLGVDGQKFHFDSSTGLFTDIWGKKLRAESNGGVVAGTQLAYWYN